MTASDQDDLTKMLAEQMRTGFAQMAEQIKELRTIWDQQLRDLRIWEEQQVKELRIGQDQIQRDTAIRFAPRDIFDVRLSNIADAITRTDATVNKLALSVGDLARDVDNRDRAVRKDMDDREKALRKDMDIREKDLRKELADEKISKIERAWTRVGAIGGLIIAVGTVLSGCVYVIQHLVLR